MPDETPESGEAADELKTQQFSAPAPDPAPIPVPAPAAAPPVAQTVLPKNPAISVVASVFVPGLGSILNGDVSIGVIILIANIVGWMLSFFLIGIPIVIGTWIWGLVDAYQGAQRWNQQHGITS